MSRRTFVDQPAVERYLELGLRLGRHNPDLVDAYHGPDDVAHRIADEPVSTAAELRRVARCLIADLDAGAPLDFVDDPEPQRRAWLRGQTRGLETVAAKLDGAELTYVEEVENCYGVTPRWFDEEEVAAAHRQLDAALAGSGSLADRLAAHRAAHVIAPDRIEAVIAALADELRDRTRAMFGLPEGERVRFDLVTDRPWSGFNYYEGNLSSCVAINTDLPVLSTAIDHLVAHEAYPGHHTEHCHKEVGLVWERNRLEQTIFLIGTPECLLAEGLADLGIEVLVGEQRVEVIEPILRSEGVHFDAEAVAAVRRFGEASSGVDGNLGLLLHDRGADVDEVAAYAQRWSLVDRDRAHKRVQFITDPTWRAYISCYVEGRPLCRDFVDGDPGRFRRLLDEQLLPSDLVVT